MVAVQLILYFLSFLVIWYCSGIIINSLTRFTQRLGLSSFAVSFFVLGILTSIPEFAVGINSILKQTPDIYVGNLLGASLVLFILVIPLLAVLGNGVKMAHKLSSDHLIFALLVVAAPVFLIADNVLTRTESVFLILLYVILFYFIEQKHGLLDGVKVKKMAEKHIVEDMIELIIASVVVFLVSQYLVNQTIYFSTLLSVSPFLISVIVLALGTNLPELTLAIRSVLEGKNEVALGDYLGSAAANTLLFGVLTFINRDRIQISTYSFKTIVMMLLGLGLFYYFSRSKQDISRREGKILLLAYVLFIIVEVIIR